MLSVAEEQCQVHFSDYGNNETVSIESIKQLDPQFYQPCAFALVVSLGLNETQDDTLQKFREWTADKEIQVTVGLGRYGWLATLYLDGVDLYTKLINENLAVPETEATENPTIELTVEEPVSLPPGCSQVYISHIDSPGQFWLQMSDKIDKIEGIQAELQANSETYKDVEDHEIGTLCVAKYSVDEQWYRAEILDSDVDITTVRFIDYGNTDVLDNQPGMLKSLPEHLKETEQFAVKCSINAVPTGTGQWTEAASDYFTELVGDLSEVVDAQIVLKDITTYVDIFIKGHNLTDKLVAEGHATRSDEPICGDLPPCFASHVNSPSEFWIQLETAAPELQTMETAMIDAEQFPELSSKEEGVLCAAKYPEDGLWYRAQVVVDGSEGTEVLFMDYGNASIATELRSLPEELQQKPALSRKCALQKPRSIKAWSRKSEIQFNELAAEGATVFKVQFIASGDISIVELYHEGSSVTEQLVALCEQAPQTERPPPLGQDTQVKGKVCYISSVNEFYVHLIDLITNLDKVSESLLKCEEFDPVADLKIGSICAAFCNEYQQWYRAKILEFCDIGAHVQFIDYGNKSKCEEFRQLPTEILTIEPLAKCCRLAGMDDITPSDDIKNKFETIRQEDPMFLIEYIDSITEPNVVNLFLNNENVTNLLNSVTLERIQTTNTESSEFNDETSKDNDELDTSIPDLNESLKSNCTVIENTLDNTNDGEIEESVNKESDEVNKDILSETIKSPNSCETLSDLSASKILTITSDSSHNENVSLSQNENMEKTVESQINTSNTT